MATFYNQATLSYAGREITSNITTGQTVEVLTAAKTALVDTYRVGDTVTYVVSLINSGSVPLTGLTVTDDLGVRQRRTPARPHHHRRHRADGHGHHRPRGREHGAGL